MTNSLKRAAAGLCALALVTAACGSDDDDSSADTTPAESASTEPDTTEPDTTEPDTTEPDTTEPDTTEPDTTEPETTEPSEVEPASGEPIPIGFQWAESGGAALPDMKSGADAAVAYINNELGGVRGRPIELEACGTGGTPESSTICANNFLDANVPAVVISADANEAVYPPILLENGVPVLANSSTSSLLVSEGSYAMGSGALGTLLAFAKYGEEQGFEKHLLIHIDNAGAAGVVELARPAFEAAGVELTTLPIASGTADATPSVQASLVDEPDYIGVFSDAPVCIAALKAYDILGLEQPRTVVAPCTTPAVVEATGEAAIGVVSFSNRIPGAEADPDAIAYRAALEEYAGADVSPFGIAALSFTAVMDMYNVLSLVPEGTEYTAETVTEAFEAVEDMPLFMSGGGFATCDGQQLPAPFVSVCSTYANAQEFDGQGQTLIGPIDPSDLLG
jgi:branched-chain amino acid transport system substrate-binding protein